MLGRSKVYLGVLAAALIVAVALLTGFTDGDQGAASAQVKAQEIGKQASQAPSEHLQTYVYWPMWRSGS